MLCLCEYESFLFYELSLEIMLSPDGRLCRTKAAERQEEDKGLGGVSTVL